MNDPRIVGACGAGADAALGTCCPRRVWRLHNPLAAVLKLQWRIASASLRSSDVGRAWVRAGVGAVKVRPWTRVYATKIYQCSVGY
jgi:hypothetical protein